MPTVLQSALLWLVVIGLSYFWTLYAMAELIRLWWRNRRTFFRVQKHPRPAVLDAPEWRHRFVRLSKIQLHMVESGNAGEKQPLMLFLHGFPEFWYSWRYQLRHFRDKFRTVAVDLRGYNDSDKPTGVSNYDLDLIVSDIAELIETMGEKAIVVGHDWGGVVAWALAIEHPDLIQRLIIMNAPHPKAATKVMRTRSAQLLKSWYIFFFQCPWLPELWVWARDFANLERCFRCPKMGLVHPENFTDEDLEAWKHVFSKPNACSPPINYYRASMRAVNRRHFPFEPVRPKTLIIWGERDAALEPEIADLSLAMCREAKLEKIADASHWVQQDVPERVNQLMADWLADLD